MDINKFSAALFIVYLAILMTLIGFRYFRKPENRKRFFSFLKTTRTTLEKFIIPEQSDSDFSGDNEKSAEITTSPKYILPLLIAIVFAILAQVLLMREFIWPGFLLYLGSAIFIFRFNNSYSADESNNLVITLKAERLCLALIMLIASFSRFNQLMLKPYGYEADGARIAGHTYFAYFAHQPGEMSVHFDSQPTLFFMQFLAMKIGGISFQSTRVLSALMGCISVLLFFYILKRLLGSVSALLGTFFYAIGFAALYAARQTHIETSVEIWVVLTYFLLIEALHRKNLILLFLSSVATAAGILCFESFYMTPIIVVFYLFIIFIQEKENLTSFAKKMAVYVIPLIPLVPIVYDYLKSRMDYHFEPMNYQASGYLASPLISRLIFMWSSLLDSLQTLFFKIRYTDSLMIFDGPMINPILLPLFFIGTVYILFQFRKSGAGFLLLWFILQYFPFGVLGAPYPRVLYPGIIPVYGLSAYGIILIISRIKTFNLRHSFFAISITFLILMSSIWFMDNNIFWNKVFDPDRRQKRHELSDLIMQGLKESDILYLPYMPDTTDDIPKEISVNALSAASVVGPEFVDQVFKVIPMQELPAQINKNSKLRSVSYLFEKSTIEKIEQRETFLSILERCYPDQTIVNGQHFDLYKIENMQDAKCYSIEPAKLLSPDISSTIFPADTIEFSWEPILSLPETSTFQLSIENNPPTAIWIEAENMSGIGGWYNDTVFVDDYAGDGYITDFWQADDTHTSFMIEEPGVYNIWVKSFKRKSNDQRNFVIINNEPGLELAKMPENQYYHWIWENIGAVDLVPGEQTLTLHRTYGDDPHFQVFIDQIAISADPTFNPVVDTEWQTVYQSEELANNNVSSFVLPVQLESGQYRWKITLYDGTHLLDWQGNTGVTSPYTEFSISER